MRLNPVLDKEHCMANASSEAAFCFFIRSSRDLDLATESRPTGTTTDQGLNADEAEAHNLEKPGTPNTSACIP
eukprot:906750-Amphidinium_carterae.2